MSRKQHKTNCYYFSPRLRNKLKQILQFPLTVMEADSGYGKTAAMAQYFAPSLKPDMQYLCYTCFGEPAIKAWQTICTILESIDQDTAQYLKGLGKPTADTIAEIAKQMSILHCSQPAVLVLDNFQLLETNVPDKLIWALSLHNCANFHIVVLTQPFAQHPILPNARILHITCHLLTFERQDIQQYFRKANIALDVEQIEQVWTITEGHAAAIYLQLEYYLNYKTFEASHAIFHLMETAFWRQIDQECQRYLTALSILEQFSLQQAMIILGQNNLPPRFTAVLNSSNFIRIDRNSKTYSFHALLRVFLLQQFDKWPLEMKNNIWRKAGDACAAINNHVNAAFFYLKADLLVMLGILPFSVEDRVGLVCLDNGAIVQALIAEPGYKTLKANPELALSLTLELFVQGNYHLHAQYLEWVQQTIFGPNQYEKNRLHRLKGEFSLMESFLAFNDVERMCICHEKAYAYMQSATKLYSFHDAWTFGAPSIVFMFWRETGKLRQELKQIRDGMPCYYRLSNQNGKGAPLAMEADILLLSGELDAAEQLCYEAIQEAEPYEQDSICFCAELTLSRIFLLQGNQDAFQDSRTRIGSRAYQGSENRCVYTSQICLAFLDMLLADFDKIPVWLYDIKAIRRQSLAVAAPFAQIIHGKILWHKFQHGKLSPKTLERELSSIIQESKNLHFLLPILYAQIYLTMAKDFTGKRTEAIELLKETFQLALPDQVYLPFAENYYEISPILDSIAASQWRKEDIKAIKRLGKQFQDGIHILKTKHLSEGYPCLSEREKQVAHLLGQRLSVNEIAELLYISPSTVRNTMQKLYKKLDIHSRKELIEKRWNL